MTRLETYTVRAILFDLDGTITDPKEGIVRCLKYALKKMDRPVPPGEDLLWCIGPPLLGSFEKLVGRQLANSALQLYRERFGTVGKFENRLYGGIKETLASLRTRGFRLFVATSKPHVFAEEILSHFALKAFFDQVYGPELDGTFSDKGELVAHLLRNEGLAPRTTLMVGDRSFDIHAAKQNGLYSIGVTYGYGSKSELKEAGADEIAASPSALLELFI